MLGVDQEKKKHSLAWLLASGEAMGVSLGDKDGGRKTNIAENPAASSMDRQISSKFRDLRSPASSRSSYMLPS